MILNLTKLTLLPLLYILLITMILSCLFCNSAWALASDANQPYYIKADQAIYDRNQHTTTYLGNVHVTQGSSNLDSDKAIVYQDQQNFITHVVAFGNFAHYSTIPQSGQDRVNALGRSIDYNPTKKIVWLLGDGHVTEGGEFFSGPHIWYNMADDLVRSSPQPNDNVTTGLTLATPSTQRTVIILPGNNHKQEVAVNALAVTPPSTAPTAQATIPAIKAKPPADIDIQDTTSAPTGMMQDDDTDNPMTP